MNQKINHYIDGLFERLPQSREAEELREELLANLNDRYEDELARGAGEEEAFQRAIESLGDLSEALGELPGAGPVYAAPPQAAAHRQNFLPWVLAALAFVALLLIAAMVFGFSSYRRALAGPPTQSVVSQALSAPAKLSDPAAAGTLEGPAAEGEYAPAEVQALELDLSFENVTIARWDGETIKVEIQFHGPAQLAPALSFQQGTLRVASPKNVILNPLDPPRGEVKVLLPTGVELPPSAVATTSGNLQLSGVQGGLLALSTTSGNLRADELTAAELAASSTSGSITVTLAAAAHSVALSSTSGDLAFSGDCESLALSSTSGNVDVAGSFAKEAEIGSLSGNMGIQGSGGALTAHTTSGSVELAGEFESVDFQSTSGNLQAELGMPTSDCRFQTTSGGLGLTLPQNSGFTLRYSTTSGQVSNAFTGHSGKGKGTDTYGAGGPLLEISTTSGNVSISEK